MSETHGPGFRYLIELSADENDRFFNNEQTKALLSDECKVIRFLKEDKSYLEKIFQQYLTPELLQELALNFRIHKASVSLHEPRYNELRSDTKDCAIELGNNLDRLLILKQNDVSNNIIEKVKRKLRALAEFWIFCHVNQKWQGTSVTPWMFSYGYLNNKKWKEIPETTFDPAEHRLENNPHIEEIEGDLMAANFRYLSGFYIQLEYMGDNLKENYHLQAFISLAIKLRIMHERSVYHGDTKESNVVFNGVDVFFIDFGFSVCTGQDERAMRTFGRQMEDHNMGIITRKGSQLPKKT